MKVKVKLKRQVVRYEAAEVEVEVPDLKDIKGEHDYQVYPNLSEAILGLATDAVKDWKETGHRCHRPDFDLAYDGKLDEKECICGHQYHRHFDSYDDMRPVGCKYCMCGFFIEG